MDAGRTVAQGTTRDSRRSLPGTGWIWILVAAAVLVTAVVAWRMLAVASHRGERAIGDGKDPATYGFDLSTCLIPRGEIVASGMPKDGLRALYLPPIATPEEVDGMRREHRSAYLVSDDRVIGLLAGGRARAYPLRVLNWHEAANDTLGGRAIAVTYSPLCDAAVVFDRNVKGRILRLGVSGLLYNSNTLYYDAHPEAGASPRGASPGGARESLWSQLQFRAIAGPSAAAGESLAVIPAFLTTWGRWRRDHPTTTVIAPESRVLYESYKADVYGSYFGSRRLRFPVRPLPPGGETTYKSRIAVAPLDDGGAARYRVVREADHAADAPALAYSFWFAWYAMHPEATPP